MKESIQAILQELQQQTKLMEYQIKLFEDSIMKGTGGNREKKQEEMKKQLHTVMSAMFKGTPMETKIEDAMKNITTLL